MTDSQLLGSNSQGTNMKCLACLALVPVACFGQVPSPEQIERAERVVAAVAQANEARDVLREAIIEVARLGAEANEAGLDVRVNLDFENCLGNDAPLFSGVFRNEATAKTLWTVPTVRHGLFYCPLVVHSVVQLVYELEP